MILWSPHCSCGTIVWWMHTKRQWNRCCTPKQRGWEVNINPVSISFCHVSRPNTWEVSLLEVFIKQSKNGSNTRRLLRSYENGILERQQKFPDNADRSAKVGNGQTIEKNRKRGGIFSWIHALDRLSYKKKSWSRARRLRRRLPVPASGTAQNGYYVDECFCPHCAVK